ncbi:hypothetical protein ACQI4L_27880 [Mycolicibacterium litorale]|uniref:hypothetical protein n=1 Tax=Mycolicibacterium litorale TaxID=758802 RepID=UPI003CF5B58F
MASSKLSDEMLWYSVGDVDGLVAEEVGDALAFLVPDLECVLCLGPDVFEVNAIGVFVDEHFASDSDALRHVRVLSV